MFPYKHKKLNGYNRLGASPAKKQKTTTTSVNSSGPSFLAIATNSQLPEKSVVLMKTCECKPPVSYNTLNPLLLKKSYDLNKTKSKILEVGVRHGKYEFVSHVQLVDVVNDVTIVISTLDFYKLERDHFKTIKDYMDGKEISIKEIKHGNILIKLINAAYEKRGIEFRYANQCENNCCINKPIIMMCETVKMFLQVSFCVKHYDDNNVDCIGLSFDAIVSSISESLPSNLRKRTTTIEQVYEEIRWEADFNRYYHDSLVQFSDSAKEMCEAISVYKFRFIEGFNDLRIYYSKLIAEYVLERILEWSQNKMQSVNYISS